MRKYFQTELFGLFGPNGKLEADFWEFHDNNPMIYKLLVKYARQWKRYHAHGSINAIYERVRWQINVFTKRDDDFKLNNNHRAFYARLIEQNEADLAGFFRMRQQRIQASFGPANETLPPGIHVS